MTPSENKSVEEPVVAALDHVGVLAEDADALFALFAETFELPVAWPMTDYGGFASGGVRAGNLNLEFIRSAGALRRFALADRPARYWIMAFQPSGVPTASMARLGAREIPCREEAPGPFWTNVTLTDLSPGSWVFICHYEPGHSEQYAALAPLLRERDGGPLGLDGVAVVTVAVRDMAEAERRWGRLLAPITPASSGCWQVGDGPAMRLEAADRDEIAALTLAVRDLDRAARFLGARGLLGKSSDDRVTVAPECLGSLRLALAATPR